MQRKFDIFKTFDIFNAETFSLIKDKILNFVLLETENFFATRSILRADMNQDNNIQFTILNNKKVYNLLCNTWRKKQLLENENIKC